MTLQIKTTLNFDANTLYCFTNTLKVRDELVRQNKIAQKWVTISSGVTIFSKNVILVCIVLDCISTETFISFLLYIFCSGLGHLQSTSQLKCIVNGCSSVVCSGWHWLCGDCFIKVGAFKNNIKVCFIWWLFHHIY